MVPKICVIVYELFILRIATWCKMLTNFQIVFYFKLNHCFKNCFDIIKLKKSWPDVIPTKQSTSNI